MNLNPSIPRQVNPTAWYHITLAEVTFECMPTLHPALPLKYSINWARVTAALQTACIISVALHVNNTAAANYSEFISCQLYSASSVELASTARPVPWTMAWLNELNSWAAYICQGRRQLHELAIISIGSENLGYLLHCAVWQKGL
jgi:hypothetical protein